MWTEETIIFDVDHLMKCRHKIRDRYYDTIVFETCDDVNAFIMANPQWGVIDTKGLTNVNREFTSYRIYLARKDDTGYSEDQIKKDFIYSSTYF